MNPAGPCKVLLLYGYRPTGDLLTEILMQDCGDEIKFANTFEEGLQLLEGWIPDLIISQHSLIKPELFRLSGLDGGLQHTPLVLIFGAERPDETEIGEVANWLALPFSAEELLAVRAAALQGRAYNNGLAE